jgi:hypothetical protein
MAQSLTVEEFALAINEALKEFAGAVDADVWYVTEKVANRAKENVVRGIKTSGIKGTGKYRKSIAVRNLKSRELQKKKVIYAKAPEYRLTHLLEYGHAKVNGGRTNAFSHWEPAERQAIEDFMNELREALSDH